MIKRINHPPLRVGVVGAGIMGQNHLRVYDMLKSVEIVAIVDSDIHKAKNIASRFDCDAYQSAEELVGKIDAASVCVPSVHHFDVGNYLLNHNVHCLIEKPLATTLEQCGQLIASAEKNKKVLLVGHIERFNPAVQQLSKILPKGISVHAIDARRMSSTSSRITDVDVVQDLMIHDIDIVLSLMRDKVVNVEAKGVHTGDASGEDYVTALISFESGAIANMSASRITQNKIRQLQLTTDLGYITLDYMTQQLLVHRQGYIGRIGGQTAEYGNYVLDLAIERVFVRNAEPLHLELQHFVDTVLNGTEPAVSGQDSLDALKIVWEIQKQAISPC